jgi:hypothetical protein
MPNETLYRVTVLRFDGRIARLPSALPDNGAVFTAATTLRIAREFASDFYRVVVEPA